jgi:hypothetical protein
VRNERYELRLARFLRVKPPMRLAGGSPQPFGSGDPPSRIVQDIKRHWRPITR